MRTRLLLLSLTTVLVGAAVPPAPTVVTPGGPAGSRTLRATPAIATVVADPGTSTLAPFRLHNGSDDVVTLTLTAVDVVFEEDGPVVTERAAGAARWVSFAEETLTLDPGDVARLRPAVDVPADADLPALVALRARDAADIGVVALVAIDAPGGQPQVVVETRWQSGAGATSLTTTLHNAGTSTAVLSVRTRLRAWTGLILSDAVTAPVLVPAGARRELVTAVETPALPGSYTASVAATTTDGTVVSSSTTTTLVGSVAAATTALALLVVASLAVRRARRRRTRQS